MPVRFSTTARSTTFSSSRTLPGHSYSASCAIASRDGLSGALPFFLAYTSRKWSAKMGMTSRRARSGGLVSAMTFRR